MDIHLRKTSLVDYPGEIAAVFFFPGCNLRCPWCQNRELLPGGSPPEGEPGFFINREAAFARIQKRRAVLGGVVLSGGEPTLAGGLAPLIRRIKDLGLKVKLDTNGMAPKVLAGLLGDEKTRPDYIALDLKLSPRRYGELLPPQGASGSAGPDAAGEPGDRNNIRALEKPGEALKKSAALIRVSGVPHEFRTLVFPNGFFTKDDIAGLIPLAAGSPWYFRPFRPGNCLDPVWNNEEETKPEQIEALTRIARAGGAGPYFRGKSGRPPG
ncbi:MAG: anaerobic ribonucleoside-triphosphate reductase activating protein [Treponema sp.]|jgi:pyruvate formate lyase activating enzyme|nr:anaerobic ribonucleoside-triphosphate reductase activating protein [Treponema sp.]